MTFSKKLQVSFSSVLKLLGYKVVHFIHVGKTGGSAIKAAAKTKKFIWNNAYISGKYVFFFEYHSFTLMHLKSDEYFFFVIRDPISRFVSGFYSRYRMGKPRIFGPWSNFEKIAFSRFSTVNQLAEALDSDDCDLKAAAEQAMKSIGHVNSSYWKWFINKDYLQKRKKSLLFYLRQENLTKDLDGMCAKFGFSFPSLPQDDVKSHRNPEYFDKSLSERARRNLVSWYREDYEFIEIIKGINDDN